MTTITMSVGECRMCKGAPRDKFALLTSSIGSLFKISLNDIFLKHHPELVGPFEGPDAIEQFQRACDLYISQRTPIVFTHGDLVAPNILLLPGPKPRVAAIID